MQQFIIRFDGILLQRRFVFKREKVTDRIVKKTNSSSLGCYFTYVQVKSDKRTDPVNNGRIE